MTAEIKWVFLYSLLTALATGLGALPFAFLRQVSTRGLALAESLAAGLMLGASFSLIAEGSHYGLTQTLTGGAFGGLLLLAGKRLLDGHDIQFGEIRGAGARRILLILAIMTLHSFSEGIAVGVSFGGGQKLATLITLAIAVHNIPEGLAISAVLRPQGASLLACAGWSIFSSLPQPLMAVPAFLFVETFQPVLPYGLGFAAGAMVLMVFLELLPEAYEKADSENVALWTTLALVAMVLFQTYL
ncbi:MAG: ZIP family metal transporter [Deltaproteobacteria bacterium]|nr:ZIP family metal transporter [Deltaproteobacteria bacterium]